MKGTVESRALMTRHNIPLGRILGIPIGLDYSWFVIFGLLTWMLAGSYYPAEFKDWQHLTTAEMATRFAEYLVNNYGVDADATWLLDHHEIHLMLHTNPDGRKEAEYVERRDDPREHCSPSFQRRLLRSR